MRRGFLETGAGFGLSLAVGVLCLAPATSASAATQRWGYELQSIAGTATGDATIAPAPCRENSSSEIPYVAKGHYEVAFTLKPRGGPQIVGGDRETDDGSVGPYLAAQNLTGRQTTHYVEEIGYSTGRGPGAGCDVVFERCEGTYSRGFSEELYAGARGSDLGRQSYRRGVKVTWPNVSFGAANYEGRCADYPPVTVANDAHPIGPVSRKAFRPSPGVLRFTVSTSVTGGSETTDGEFPSITEWSYRAKMKLRRVKVG